MKFICTKENLARGLHAVSRAASKNISLPILNNVLLIADDGGVKLQTTNLEVAVTTTVRAKVETPGRFTANSRLLTEYVSTVANEKLTIEATTDGLRVVSENTDSTITGLSAEEFPILPTIHDGVSVVIPTGVFRTALQETVFSAANDESRPEISGVYVSILEQKVVFAATDSYRLSERVIQPSTPASGTAKAIVPLRASQEILRILDTDASETTLTIDERQALVRCGETELITRLIEGQYPDYQQIIPKKNDTVIVLPKNELVNAIKAASLFSQPGVHDLAIHIQPPATLTLKAASAQTGHHTATVQATIEGPEKDVVFNNRYLLEGVQNLPGDEVRLEFGDPQAPGVVRSTATNDAVYLIMPIRQ